MQKKKRKQNKKPERKWIRNDLISAPPKSAESPNNKKEQWSPADVFEIFFVNDVIELIIRFSKIYAAGKGFHNFQVSMEEMRAFLALLLLSGYASLPRRRMYWEKQIDVNKEVFTRTLPRHRFEEILRFFHLADNNNLHKDDKFAKIRATSFATECKILK